MCTLFVSEDFHGGHQVMKKTDNSLETTHMPNMKNKDKKQEAERPAQHGRLVHPVSYC